MDDSRRNQSLGWFYPALLPLASESPQDLGRALVRLSHLRTRRSQTISVEVRKLLEASMNAIQRSRESIARTDNLLARMWGDALDEEQSSE